MTLSELDFPPRPSLVEPRSPESFQGLARVPVDTGLSGGLFSPNIAALPVASFQKATHLLGEMHAALSRPDVEAFNESKRALTLLLKRHGEPITQWNPLVLELFDGSLLEGAQLGNIQWDMVSLRALRGPLFLTGASFQSAGLFCANLSGAVLGGADFSGADLRFADFREACLQKAIFVESNLGHANLNGADLTEADLYCARLNDASAKQTLLKTANLRKADLRHADLYQATLASARLQQADLREANLFMADLTDARLRQADLRGANLGFALLQEARFPCARLSQALLNSANLTAANLENACLSDAQFSRAVLKGANLRNATLTGADFSEALGLDGAAWQNAFVDEATRFPKDFKAGGHGAINASCGAFRRLGQTLSRFLGLSA